MEGLLFYNVFERQPLGCRFIVSLATVADAKIGIHQFNGAKFGSRLYNPYNDQIGQHGIGHCGVAYLVLYRLQNIIKKAVMKAKIFTLTKGNPIIRLAASISK